jgi:microcystin-dependent protein
MPVGSIMLWHNDSPPDRWLPCDGREVAIANYTGLYNLITLDGSVFPYGTNTNGSGGAGSTHFRLPDMTDRFALNAVVSTNSASNVANAENHSHNFSLGNQYATSNYQGHQHTYSPGNLAAADSASGHSHSVNINFDSNDHNAYTNVKRAATGNTTAAFQAHGHNASATPNAANVGHGHSITGGTGYTNTDNHAHGVTATIGNYSPVGSSTPAHQRIYFIVFAGGSS